MHISAVAQTIDNHQNAIITLAAHIERVEMRMDALRDQLRYVLSLLSVAYGGVSMVVGTRCWARRRRCGRGWRGG